MKQNFSKTFTACALLSVFFASALIVPMIVSAQTTASGSSEPSDTNFQIVPCNSADGVTIDPTTGTNVVSSGQPVTPCNFAALILLIQRIINFLLYAAIFIATLSIVYAGFEYLTAGGDTGKTKKAKDIIKVTVIGFAIALCSWLVVYTIITTVMNPNFPAMQFLNQQ